MCVRSASSEFIRSRSPCQRISSSSASSLSAKIVEVVALAHDDFATAKFEDACVVAEDFAEWGAFGKFSRIHSAERRGGEEIIHCGVRHVRVERGVPALRTFENGRCGGHFLGVENQIV